MDIDQAREIVRLVEAGQYHRVRMLQIAEALMVLWQQLQEANVAPQPAEPNHPLTTAARARWDYVMSDQRNMRERIEKLEWFAVTVKQSLGAYL